MKSAAAIACLIILTATGAWAADWQWPSQMSLGGFTITDIRGTAKADGSGRATGTLQAANLGTTSVNLTRSARGDVSGSASIDARGVRGSFTLTSGGLRGQGIVDCAPRSIVNASINISPRGEVSGGGRMGLGRLNASVDFSLSGSSCSFRGSTPVRAQVDTPIATYKLDGSLALQGGGGRMSATASGRVERTSKLANQVTSFAIPNTSVDVSNGQCTVNVGGVSITFSLF